MQVVLYEPEYATNVVYGVNHQNPEDEKKYNHIRKSVELIIEHPSM